MARRKSKAKQEEEFLQALFALVGLGGFFAAYYFTKSFETSVMVALVLIALAIAILIFRKMSYIDKLKKSGIHDIDKMDGIQFEQYLSHLFKAQGHSVKVTRAAGDYGADLVLKKDGKKIVVQAKRHNKNIGIEAVQEIFSAKNYYQADEAWVVSNRDYTEAARNLAQTNQVRLIGREELIEMILKMNPNAVPKPKQVMQEHPTITKVCDRCGRPMVRRKGPNGEFFGCSGFPKCRNTSSI